jgi:hypothetical protein
MLHHVNEVAGDAVAVISTGDMTSRECSQTFSDAFSPEQL